MGPLNYISLNDAYNDTFISQNFDIENTIKHKPQNTYEEIINNLNNLKANGKININEQQSNNSLYYQHSCDNILMHIQKCEICKERLRVLINYQLENSIQEETKKKHNTNNNNDINSIFNYSYLTLFNNSFSMFFLIFILSVLIFGLFYCNKK